jgi:hypothetical protein
MKNLTKLSIIALLITLSSESYCQTFGIKAGFNLPFMVIEKSQSALPYLPYSVTTVMKNGYHFGGILEIPVYKMFSIESGLIYSTTGYIQSHNETIWPEPLKVTETYNLGFLNIPLAAKASFPIGNINIYGSAGPYFGFGLSGNKVTESTYGDLVETEKESIQWGSEQGADDIKRYDYGVTLGAGVEVKSFQIGVSYNLAMANLSPASSAGSNINNSVLGVSVGYLFGGSKKAGPAAQMAGQSKEVKKADSPENSIGKSKGKKAIAIEAERLQLEKVRADSIAAVKVEEERIRALKIEEEKIRTEKAESDRIEAARLMAANLAVQQKERLAKIKADSITAAHNTVVYRVQFASNTAKKGSYEIIIGGKKYSTWEYSYSGAYRSTVGEFNTYKSALEFQKNVRQSGYPQAFVVALKNNVRTTDPTLLK